MHPPHPHQLSPGLTLLMAVACGTMVGNLYYAQTLVEVIAPDIGMAPSVAGAIVTLTQLGYGVGLALIVPLSDLVENKRLILTAAAGAIIGSLGVAISTNAPMFLLASLVTGICSVGVQILVPLAAHLSSEERQGRTVGLVMSGLLTGIMLARPVASFITEIAGWRAVFVVAAIVTTLITLALAARLPTRQPAARLGYGRVLASTLGSLVAYRALRLRAALQALMFVAFNLFWTAAPLALYRQFGASHGEVALFALAGAGGALAAPIAGHLTDQGRGRVTSLAAFVLLILSFLAADLAVAVASVIAFAVTAILIDAAVQLSQIANQRVIFALAPESRGRINAAYSATMFFFGAFGSTIGSVSYVTGGWRLSALIGAALGGIALILFVVFERRPIVT